jgi:hypothetical protein
VVVQWPDTVVVDGEPIQVKEREMVVVPCAVKNTICSHCRTISEADFAVILDAIYLLSSCY